VHSRPQPAALQRLRGGRMRCGIQVKWRVKHHVDWGMTGMESSKMMQNAALTWQNGGCKCKPNRSFLFLSSRFQKEKEGF